MKFLVFVTTSFVWKTQRQVLLWALPIFLLLFYRSTLGAPLRQVDPEAGAPPATTSPPPTLVVEDQLSPSQPAKATEKAQAMNYPYFGAVAGRAGVLVGIHELPGAGAIHGLLGVQYTFRRTSSPRWETGLDLLTGGYGLAHFGQRFTFRDRAALRPFWRLGMTLKLIPKQELNTFLNWDNYLVRVGAGLEDWLFGRVSVRLDLEGALGIEHQHLALTFGYSWGH